MRNHLHPEIDSNSYAPGALDRRIARRLQQLRTEQGWTLETLATRTGTSRATLSRIERGELSATATLLSTLCGQYGWTLSRLMAEAEITPAALVRAQKQVIWKDPASGYVRRVLSPPDPHLRGELVEVTLPPGAKVEYGTSPLHGLEHHLWMLSGTLNLEIEGAKYRLSKGDCLRYVLTGASRFVCSGRSPARYVIALVHP